MAPFRILLADDHEVVRAGLRALLEEQSGWEVVAEAVDGRDAVEKATKLKPDVVRIRFDIGEDWSGDPAIFFRILLSDQAAREDRLTLTTRRVRAALGELKLVEIGLFPLHSFRSESEQEELNEASWAQ